MRIYRLQSDDDKGITRDYNIFNCIQNLLYDYSHLLSDGTERRQQPDADFGTDLQTAYFNGLIYKGSPYIFGFCKITDLYTWFCPAMIGSYESNNIYIYEYDVPQEYVIMGTRQCIFNPKYATYKCKISHKQLRKYK